MWQDIVANTLVLAAAAFAVARGVRKARGGGHSACSGCPANGGRARPQGAAVRPASALIPARSLSAPKSKTME